MRLNHETRAGFFWKKSHFKSLPTIPYRKRNLGGDHSIVIHHPVILSHGVRPVDALSYTIFYQPKN